MSHALPIDPDDFRLFVDSVDDYALYMLDPGGHILSWNRGAERLKGWRADEVLGRHVAGFYLPDERAAGLPAHELRWAAETGRYRGESWRVRRDGTRFWADVTITALRGPDGRLRGFAHITRDLTERKQHAERLLAAGMERARREAHDEEVRGAGATPLLRTGWRRLVLSVALPLLVLGAQATALPALREAPFVLSYAAVFVVSWLAGRSAGWLAILVATLATDFLLLPPMRAFDLHSLEALVAFVLCSSVLVELLHRSRRSVSAALRVKGRERARLLALQAAGIGTFELDLASGQLVLDERCRSLFGLSATAEVTQEGLIASIHPDDRSRVHRARQWALDPRSGGHYDVEYRVIGVEDRAPRWLAVSGRVSFDGEARPLRFLGAVSDIGGRKQAEAEAEESRRAQRALVDQSPIGIFSVDGDGRFIEVNRAACRLLEVDCDELPGKPIADLLSEDERQRLSALRRRLEPGAVDVAEWILRTGGGRQIPVELTAWVLPDGRWQAFCRDISERRAAEERSRAEAQFRERVVAIVGHDLRSPLTALMMSARMLERVALGPREAQALGRIVRAGERMQRLVGDVLDWSQFRAGGLALVPEPVDAGELCRAVLDEVRAGRPDRDLQLRASGDLRASLDSGRLAQALGNLLANAVKYGAEGTPITLRAEGREDEVWLSVHNLGDPIPPELRPHLFEAFHQGRGERRPGSVGLGLYITERVVRAHGGRIEVESSATGGTRFTMRLPRGLRASQPPPPMERVVH